MKRKEIIGNRRIKGKKRTPRSTEEGKVSGNNHKIIIQETEAETDGGRNLTSRISHHLSHSAGLGGKRQRQEREQEQPRKKMGGVEYSE